MAADSKSPVASVVGSGTIRRIEALAFASVVLGSLACLTFFLFPACALFAFASVLCAQFARLIAKRAETPSEKLIDARRWANAGLVLSVVGVVVSGAIVATCVLVVDRGLDEKHTQYESDVRAMTADPDHAKRVEELRRGLKALDTAKPAVPESTEKP